LKLGIKHSFLSILAVLLVGVAGAQAETSAAVIIRADEPGAAVSPNLFGVFFEEINYAGEGGLYAEMVRNRTFHSSKPDFWTLETQGDAVGMMSVDATVPLNDSTPNSLRLTMKSGSGSVGACNAGFWGMSLAAGATYNLDFFAKSSDAAGPIDVRLESGNGGHIYAQASLHGVTGQWRHVTTALVSSGTDTNARLVVAISRPGTVWLDMVSLFPQATFHGRPNGLRLDLADKIADLRPSFLRFPGGNFIEGYHVANALRWKKTIGAVAERPGHFNDSWGYWSTDGLGAHEFFQFCEDVGMEPLYALNAGLMLNYTGAADNTVPLDQLKPWVQDALNLIEYANGGPDTPWGARRAAAGHPAPFNLKYLEIGNENGGPFLDERYSQFYDAIKSNYSSVHLIVPGNWTGGSPWSRPVEIADEHYYDSPAAFLSYAIKYDSYSRRGPKIFVGEYAVTSGFGTHGNLAAALGEAAFMTGLERNSDLVKLASYAPLLANVNDLQWRPDLIYFNNASSFGTPSYYVQQIFAKNRGDVVLPATVDIPTNSPWFSRHGAIGLGSWNTAVEFADLEVKNDDGTLFKHDFGTQHPRGWRVFKGDWNATGGGFQQTNVSLTDCRATVGDTNWANYSVSLRARKHGGSEGFLILFNWLDDDNWTWLNVGGWGNTLTAVEQSSSGAKAILGTPVPQTILANTWYDLRIDLSGPRIRCYVNGVMVQDVAYPGRLLVSSTYARAAGQIIVKTVNPDGTPLTTTFSVKGADSVAPEATLIQLTSASSGDENSFDAPTRIFPVTNVIASVGGDYTVELPANSLSVLRLRAAGFKTITNLSLQLPPQIRRGQCAPASVWGKRSDSSAPLNLTGNEHHAITYSSDHAAVATVDVAGQVTGITGGSAGIIATYESLGLSATQTVEVVGVPIQLVHRYSFSESSGTVCADSIGGAAWNGTLPAGGTFRGGQLTLSAAAAQYVQLPAGILSNYTAVTIEGWMTFSRRLPENCFLFGFGNINGNEGNNYLFCAPQSGRVAITDGNYAQEQSAGGNLDFSFRSKLHLTAVFNPPLGCLALYTNGVLAAVNHNVTTPVSSVRDVYNYINRSLYSPDPYADLSLDEFRIYNGALSAVEIAETQALGPDRLTVIKRPLSQRRIVW
jgi:alpha-L-arabinofuranosidase